MHRSDARLIDNVIMRDVNKISGISWLALVFVLQGNFIPSCRQYNFYLNLHPASEVISQKVGSHRVEHVNLVGFECYSFLVKVVPENIKT